MILLSIIFIVLKVKLFYSVLINYQDPNTLSKYDTGSRLIKECFENLINDGCRNNRRVFKPKNRIMQLRQFRLDTKTNLLLSIRSSDFSILFDP